MSEDAMRVTVIGTSGQITRSLQERAAGRSDIHVHAVGRPTLDLAKPQTILPEIARSRPQVIVNAAAYTAVDTAEGDAELAFRINGEGAGAVGAAAAKLGVPVVQLSTDYVFDGEKGSAYVETDAVNPRNVYGQSKLEGERAVAAANRQHLIVRTSWVYAPYGKNFVATMLALARTRDHVSVVDDQTGCPTFAIDIADALLSLVLRLQSSEDAKGKFGIYHLAAPNSMTWCAFAQRIFAISAASGGPAVRVEAIATAAYPTLAARPKNSSLDCGRLVRVFATRLPGVDNALRRCIPRLLGQM